MATILAFRPANRTRSGVPDPEARNGALGALGDVVLFTGVRYERADEPRGTSRSSAQGEISGHSGSLRDDDHQH